MSYLKSFIIGSSYPSFILFFLAVKNIQKNIKNYTYTNYTLVAPVYLGIMNILSLYFAQSFNLSLRNRFMIVGLLSPLIVATFAKFTNSYNYTSKQWKEYYAHIFTEHFLIFNMIIYIIEKSL